MGACRWRTTTPALFFGRDMAQARAVALAQDAFHNVAFYGGALDSLMRRITTK